MSASADLCSRDHVKTYLGLAGIAHDTELDQLIDAASEAIESWCDRAFALTEHTEYFDGRGSSRILLHERPAQSVAGVWQDANRDYDEAAQLDAEDFTFYPDSGILQRISGVFAKGIRNVKVTYTAGYADVPKDARQACIVLVAAWFHKARAGGDGMASKRAGDFSANYPADGWPDATRELLARYRNHPVV